jgi:hypothetical protein
MEPVTRPLRRRVLLFAGGVVVLSLLSPPTTATGRLTVVDGSARETMMIDWAVGRFRAAGLALPAVEVSFHADASGCAGNSGYYLEGRLDLCAGHQNTPYARKVIIHELSHAWINLHVSWEMRAAFLKMRGLESWGDPDQAWGLRGSEQAAEVITRFLGPGLTPLIPGHPDDEELAAAYRLLTGASPPILDRSGEYG